MKDKNILFLSIIILLALPNITLAQWFIDYPSKMEKDTLWTAVTRTTRDIWFNDKGARGFQTNNSGAVDLHLYYTIASTGAGSDSVVVEGYGLTAKKIDLTGTVALTTLVHDSTRIATLVSDSTFYVYALESLYTNFPMYDGVRLVFKKNGNDADSTSVYSNCRVTTTR